jgi:putative transposase
MLTGRRFRVEFTNEQADYADQIGAVCRAVWNIGLEQRREYRRRGAWMDYHEQARELAAAKVEHPWLAEVPAHCLQQTLMDLDTACRAHGAFKVRWRSSRRWRPSFRFPQGSKMTVERLNRRHARVKLPKLGWVRFRLTRGLDGTVIRSATLTRDGTRWFVSFLVDDGQRTPEVHPLPGTAVGVDRGVVIAVATSNGDLLDRAFVTPGEQRRTRQLQRRLSRAAKRGRNRDKNRAALANVRARERRRRQDFCAQTARELAATNEVVVLEDLKTAQMTRSAKGTLKQPGTNVKSKSGLNRAILAKGWHEFELALASAARYTGTAVMRVPAQYTSQRCSVCGQVDPRSRESQAVFRCTSCSHAEHADVNAARNILAAGLAVTACEDLNESPGSRGSSKQEPAGNREELLLPPAPQREWVGIPGIKQGEDVNRKPCTKSPENSPE